MKNLLSIILSVVAVGISIFALTHIAPATSFGATSNAGANALYEQSLAQPLGTTDANMYVTSGADIQGNLLPLNSYQCLSVDTGQPNFEAICGNVTASATSGLTLAVTLRGLNTATATTSNPTYIFTHRRGADVRITDFPTLTVVNNELNGVQNIPNPIFYSSNFTPTFWSGAASNTIATIGIVNSTAAAGCGFASMIANGCSQLATAVQTAAGTVTGSTGANLVPANSLFNSAQSATTIVPVTGSNGKISQNFLDLTQAFTTTGQWTLNSFATIFGAGLMSNASSTFTATTTQACSNVLSVACVFNRIPYAFPSTQGAAGTVWVNNGSGVLSNGTPNGNQYNIASTTSAGTTSGNVTSFTLTIPAGTLTASSSVAVDGDITCTGTGGLTKTCSIKISDTNGTNYVTSIGAATQTNSTYTMPFHADIVSNNSTSAQTSIITGLGGGTDISAGNTSSANWANATGFNIIAVGTGTGSITLNVFSIKVRP